MLAKNAQSASFTVSGDSFPILRGVVGGGKNIQTSISREFEVPIPSNKEIVLKDTTDSKIFFDRVEQRIKNGDETLKAMIDEYTENWEGKFAFLVADKRKKEFLAFRGITATLFRYPLFIDKDGNRIPIGYLINTEKQSLQNALVLFSNLAHIIYGINIPIDIKLAEELDINSVYRLDELEPVKISEVKEKFPKVREIPKSSTTTTHSTLIGTGVDKSTVITFIENYYIDSLYFELFVIARYDKSVQQLTDKEVTDLKLFLNRVSVSKKAKKIWKNLLTTYNHDCLAIHERTGLSFPYFCQPNKDIIESYRKSIEKGN
jgi:predicted SpoU family rRNA methylase